MKKKDQPLDLVVKKEEKAAGRFKRARGLKALASDKSEGCEIGLSPHMIKMLNTKM